MRLPRALVAICPHRPPIPGNILGHTGWGFEYPDGTWRVGAVEGEGWQNGNHNGFWTTRARNLDEALHVFAQSRNRGAEYDHYKLLEMTPGVRPHPEYAEKVAQWIQRQSYQLFGRNCMDSTYDVLVAFGGGHPNAPLYNGKVLPKPGENWIPNGWFNALPYSDHRWLPQAFQTRSVDLSDALETVGPASGVRSVDLSDARTEAGSGAGKEAAERPAWRTTDPTGEPVELLQVDCIPPP